MQRFSLLIGLLFWLVDLPAAQAGCSGYLGRVVINEVLTTETDGYDPFVELFVAQNTTIPEGWVVTVQGNQGNSGAYTQAVPAGSYTAPSYIVLYFSGGEIKNPGNDVLLQDEFGDDVDFVRFGGRRSPISVSCGSLDTDRQDYHPRDKQVCTMPDGGNWESAACSPTPGGSNTDTGGAVGHYALSYDSVPGITCATTEVTITAHDGGDPDAAMIPTAGTQVSLGAPGDCSLTPAVVTFDGSSSSVTSALSCSTVGVKILTATDGDGASLEPTESPDIEFVAAKLQFYNATAAESTLPSQIASKRSDIAPDAAVLQLRSIETDPETGACVARIPAAPATVSMSLECKDPSSCIAGQQARVFGSDGVAVSLPGDVGLEFDADGRAPIPFDYNDAGLVQLHAWMVLPATSELPELTLSGSSNDFVVRPVGLCVEVDHPDADCASLDGSCSVFRQAGEAFELSVRAVGWESVSDTDFCDTNLTTPNYQASAIALSSDWAGSETGVAGTLGVTSVDILTNGSQQIPTQTVSEVGVFTFNAEPPSYFSETLPTAVSSPVGRFTPAYFDLSNTLLANRAALSCTDSFSYLGEGMRVSLRLSARNQAGQVTQNYQGSFAKFSEFDELGLTAVDRSGSGQQLSDRISQESGLSFSSSLGLVDVVAPFAVARATNEDGPFLDVAVGSQALDSDDIGLQTAAFDLDADLDGDNDSVQIGSATQLLFGRLRVENGFGPETEALPLVAQMEYFDGAGYAINSQDSCTPIAVDILDPALGRIASGSLISVGDGQSEAGFNATAVVAGDLGLSFGAPGAGNSGEIEFQLSDSGTVSAGVSSLPWLLYDWDGDGDYDDEPGSRTATFGRYRGNDRVIFWQENFSQ